MFWGLGLVLSVFQYQPQALNQKALEAKTAESYTPEPSIHNPLRSKIRTTFFIFSFALYTNKTKQTQFFRKRKNRSRKANRQTAPGWLMRLLKFAGGPVG